MKTVAIIPAGGVGIRMDSEIRKQYMMLCGLPIIIHTLNVFQRTLKVDDIFLILPEEDVDKAQQTIVRKYQLSKVKRILPGGLYRQDSVKMGIDAVDSNYDIVVIHDGVRPFVSEELIEIAIRGAIETGAAVIGIPAKDTIKMTDANGFVMETLNRNKLWLTQTPQAFKVSLIKEAYKHAYRDNYYGTDDAVLIERMSVKVIMLPGSAENIKITTKSDLILGEHILAMHGYREL